MGETRRIRDMPSRYDYEVPVSKCVDFLLKRIDIDPKRIAVSPDGKVLALASLPIFGGIFFLLYRILLRYGSGFAILAVVGGAVFLGYLVWSVFRSSD